MAGITRDWAPARGVARGIQMMIYILCTTCLREQVQNPCFTRVAFLKLMVASPQELNTRPQAVLTMYQ